MPKQIPEAVIIEKNKLHTPGAWLILLDVKITAGAWLYYSSGNENTIWSGNTYEPMPFMLGNVEDSGSGELPSMSLKIANAGGVLSGLVDEHRGASDGEVTIHVFTSQQPDADMHELDAYYSIMDTSVAGEWVALELGAPSPLRMAYPEDRYLAHACPWVPYFGLGFECGYSGALTTCGGTYEDCEERAATGYFGGCLGLDPSGWRVA